MNKYAKSADFSLWLLIYKKSILALTIHVYNVTRPEFTLILRLFHFDENNLQVLMDHCCTH